MLSMTAFAKRIMQYDWGHITCEIRSVNQRYLDIYIDIPQYNKSPLLWKIRKSIQDFITRGKIECSIHIKKNTNVSDLLVINKQLVYFLIKSAKWVQSQVDVSKEIDLFAILSWPEVITYKPDNIPSINLDILTCVESTLYSLICLKQKEGEFLRTKILEKLDHINKEINKIRKYIPKILEYKRKKFFEYIDDFSIKIDSNRLEQGLLILLQKFDISEEIDRLTSHLQIIHEIIACSEKSVGKQLDFFIQELNRETHTISSKSMDINVTQSAISLKLYIEQIREQIQNIE